MSLKSRKRADKAREKSPPSNPLPLQKLALRTAMREYLGASIAFLIFIVITVVCVLPGGITFPQALAVTIGGIVLSITFGVYFVSVLRCFAVFQKFKMISDSTTHRVSINCRRVSFLLFPVSKYSSVVLYIVLTDHSGEKFYYVFPHGGAPSEHSKKHISDMFFGLTFDLLCYQGTNIIKELPPYTQNSLPRN